MKNGTKADDEAERHELLAKPPDKPHLALRHEQGLFIAIPPGAVLAEVLGPGPRGTTMLLLTSVNENRWNFRCMCNPQCHAVARAVLVWEGSHQGGAKSGKGKRR